ncbi:hypothetical protein B0T19DRAFT_6391 [Cercophora scortea]|uniref:Uncharacterized protein n=1 Tax=Cercophora scortea TaxID=314031 RepID=A0AAE0MKU8_9PEZI|nr:hypothetical protein B0T19DRAFT_6391 [Cercophora scortea]
MRGSGSIIVSLACSALLAHATTDDDNQKLLLGHHLPSISSGGGGGGVRNKLKSCEETYGLGSMRCGDESSTFCYNPSIGQTCCKADNSYCSGGKYCAPVAGYCCNNDEDLATCARVAGFELELARLTSTPRSAVVAPIRTALSTPLNATTVDAGFPATDDGTWRSSSDASSRLGLGALTAGKDRRLVWVVVGMGAVGLFMLSC